MADLFPVAPLMPTEPQLQPHSRVPVKGPLKPFDDHWGDGFMSMALIAANGALQSSMATFRRDYPDYTCPNRIMLLAALVSVVRPPIDALTSFTGGAVPDAICQRIRILLAVAADSVALAFKLDTTFITDYTNQRALNIFLQTKIVNSLTHNISNSPGSTADQAADLLNSFNGTHRPLSHNTSSALQVPCLALPTHSQHTLSLTTSSAVPCLASPCLAPHCPLTTQLSL